MRETFRRGFTAIRPAAADNRHAARAHRRRRLLAFLVAAAGMAPPMIVPIGAATIETDSKIDQVTVYPDGALVRRVFAVELPAGSHEIVIANLPPSIDQASLRVEGSAEGRVSIGAVDFRLSAAIQPPNHNAAKLKTLRAEHDAISDRIDALEGKRSMIRRLADRAGEAKEGRTLEPDQWSKAWDQVGSGLAQVNQELRTQRIALARVEEEIRALAAADGPQRPLPPRRIAVISVDAASAGKASLALAYRVTGASWRPVYDARLATGGAKPQLDLVQRAMVRQQTGEDWPEASLTLSTLRVAGGTATPDLHGERIAFFEPRPVPMPRATMAPAPMAGRAPGEMARQDEDRARIAAVAPPPQAPIEESQATLESTAFQSEFQLPERFSLPTGNQEKSVRLGSLPTEATLSHRTSPALDAKAYLEAKFEVKGESPLLAGEVLLTRDGSFIGKGRIAQAAPGETLRLGFGADDRVAVKRVPVGRRARDPGILGSTRQEDLRFRIDVKNLHAFAIDLTIVDRIPISEDREITVERLPDMTKPDAETIEDRRGTFAWKPALKPGEAKSFTTAYRLRWPAGREVRLQPLR